MLAKRTSSGNMSFNLKGEFRDGIALRYGKDPETVPSSSACGEHFNKLDTLHCPKIGYTHIRHNDISDSMRFAMMSK